MRDKWKLFEKLVAAIHSAETIGATVKWDEKINGRQFDVTIRFKMGLYNYLTVIECKDTSSPVPVGDVDAFVTKSQDAHANKAIMVAHSGFQKGCMAVAERHDIGLYTLIETESLPESYLREELIPALRVYDFRILLADNTEMPLREDRGRLPYLINKSVAISPTQGTKTFKEIIDLGIQSRPGLITTEEHELTCEFPIGTVVTIPYECEKVPAKSITYKIMIISAQMMRRPGLDPRILSKAYAFHDVLGQTSRTIQAMNVRIHTGDTIEVGRFYENKDLEIIYYCESIDEKDMISFILLESYQHGLLVQATIKQFRKDVQNLVEVTEEEELMRLGKMLQAYTHK